MITEEFQAEVLRLREQGLNWAEISRALGRPKRTCQRAAGVGVSAGYCAEDGCDGRAVRSGRYCREHGTKRMKRTAPGEGPKQLVVMKLMRKHGMLTFEQLRLMTGFNSDILGRVLGRLLELGLIERPVRAHYRMPVKPTS